MVKQTKEDTKGKYYAVERIVGKVFILLIQKITKNKIHYLVKWRGFDESSNTWEPLNNLGKVDDLIEQYQKRA